MLCCAVLCCAVLCCAVLCCAVLCCVVLCCVVLCCVVLCCVVLCCVVLCCVVLCCVVLCCVMLFYFSFRSEVWEIDRVWLIGRYGVLYTLCQPCMNISVLEGVCSLYWPPYELSDGLLGLV